LACSKDFRSIAFPVVASGSGGRSREWALSLVLDALWTIHYEGRVVAVRYAKREAA
jgi:hypothetical protein